MVCTPKIIGLMSCGFLLCLGLSNAAQADNVAPAVKGEKAGKPHTRQPGGPRIGGQGGKGGKPATGIVGDASRPHTRQSGGPRVGGQGAEPDSALVEKGEEAGTDHTRQPSGPRVGGQSGQ